MTHTISAVEPDRQRLRPGLDRRRRRASPAPTPSLIAQLGFGPDGSNPAGNAAWSGSTRRSTPTPATTTSSSRRFCPETTGAFDYAYRYTTTDGRDWLYADLDGIGNGYCAGAGRAR